MMQKFNHFDGSYAEREKRAIANDTRAEKPKYDAGAKEFITGDVRMTPEGVKRLIGGTDYYTPEQFHALWKGQLEKVFAARKQDFYQEMGTGTVGLDSAKKLDEMLMEVTKEVFANLPDRQPARINDAIEEAYALFGERLQSVSAFEYRRLPPLMQSLIDDKTGALKAPGVYTFERDPKTGEERRVYLRPVYFPPSKPQLTESAIAERKAAKEGQEKAKNGDWARYRDVFATGSADAVPLQWDIAKGLGVLRPDADGDTHKEDYDDAAKKTMEDYEYKVSPGNPKLGVPRVVEFRSKDPSVSHAGLVVCREKNKGREKQEAVVFSGADIRLLDRACQFDDAKKEVLFPDEGERDCLTAWKTMSFSISMGGELRDPAKRDFNYISDFPVARSVVARLRRQDAVQKKLKDDSCAWRSLEILKLILDISTTDAEFPAKSKAMADEIVQFMKEKWSGERKEEMFADFSRVTTAEFGVRALATNRLNVLIQDVKDKYEV
ncbi:MAG: hypothetical protein V1926_02310 [Candidatus Peregrinibacteria bacterium]